MPCAPLAEATAPWLRIATENDTVLPFAGVDGDQLTDDATRSELSTGRTTSEVGLVKELFASFCSMTVLSSSTLADRGYVPAFWTPMFAETVVEAPAASA